MSRLWFNPLRLIFPPLLVIFSIPLAIFAVITTFLAISFLCIYGAVIYVSFGLKLLQSYIEERHRGVKQLPLSPHSTYTSPSIPQRSRTNSSPTTATPANRSQSYASLFAHNRANRDYEGVGGWRDTNDDSDEAQWLNMNANLELPASSSDFAYSGSSSPTSIRRRHHVRSSTGGSQRLLRESWYAATPGGGGIRAGSLARRTGSDSPSASRNRTPSSGSEEPGYFTQVKKRRKSTSGILKGGTQEHQEGQS